MLVKGFAVSSPQLTLKQPGDDRSLQQVLVEKDAEDDTSPLTQCSMISGEERYEERGDWVSVVPEAG